MHSLKAALATASIPAILGLASFLSLVREIPAQLGLKIIRWKSGGTAKEKRGIDFSPMPLIIARMPMFTGAVYKI